MQTENDLLPPSFCEPLENAPPTPSLEPAAVAPVAAQERIITLDVLRGAVLLGILLMNILSFSLPGRA